MKSTNLLTFLFCWIFEFKSASGCVILGFKLYLFFQDLKRSIIDDGLSMIVNLIIIPHSGWDPSNPGETCWSTIFRNTSGVLR
jgi:hypothetical protein